MVVFYMRGRATSHTDHVRLVVTRTLTLILVVAGLLLLAGYKPWAKGAILGGIASLVNLLVIAVGIGDQMLGKGARKAAARFALRMLITGGALVYAGMNDSIALGAAIPTLFIAQAVLVFNELAENDKMAE